jgi:hypothetical protein
LEYELGNAITAFECDALLRIVIDHDALQLTAKASINSAWCIDHSHTMLDG